MPLLNRKAVEIPAIAKEIKSLDKSTLVWMIKATGEIFSTYDEYSNRMAFYGQPIFQCETTLRNGLTFLEALQSEHDESERLDSIMSRQLMSKVLEKAHWSTQNRLDQIVDEFIEYFKAEYLVGETVNVEVGHSKQAADVLRRIEANAESRPVNGLGASVNGDQADESKPGLASYELAFISSADSSTPRETFILPANKISRDRSTWSKAILRNFLRNSLTKENWPGAPWLVKRALSDKLGLGLDYDNVPEAVKLAEAQRQEGLMKKAEDKAKKADARKRGRESDVASAGSLAGDDGRRKKVKNEDEETEPVKKKIRYPMEDLDVPLETFAFLTDQRPVPNKDTTIPMTFFESLLLNWIFLQTFGKPLEISPFTLDDFSNALRHSQSDVRCEMVCEIYASLLLTIALDRRLKGGTGVAASTSASLTLPPSATHLTSSAIMSREGSNSGAGPAPPLQSDQALSPIPLNSSELANGMQRTLVADELQELRSRALEIAPDWSTMNPSYKKGRPGWERMLLGCIADLARPTVVPNIEKILKTLVGETSNQEDDLDVDDRTLTDRYISLDTSDKISLIAFLSDLAVGTKVIRDYMDECEANLTELRKEKIEISRNKKRILDERWQLEHPGEERLDGGGKKKKGEKGSKSASKQKTEDRANSLNEEDDDIDDESGDDGDQSDGNGDESDTGSIRQAQKQARAASRQAILRERAELRAAEDANRHAQYAKARDIARAKTEGQKQIQAARRRYDEEEYRLLRREDQIERDMRKLACFRGKPLGRDRFMNRYWWMDGVGVNLLGLGGQVTYGTGRIFLQSASAVDMTTLEALIPAKDLESRRKKEEGTSSLQPGEWGFYSEAEQIDDLLAWCNPKGVREFQLKNAIVKNYNYITGGMKRRQMDLASTTKSMDARRSQRAKVANAELGREGHMAWTNKRARE